MEPAVRSNLVIAIGDLAFRFPNLLEPWTANIYKPLSDPDDGALPMLHTASPASHSNSTAACSCQCGLMKIYLHICHVSTPSPVKSLQC